MAYKYTKGSVRRGDIYNQDDTQGNTYIDWNEDALGVVAGGTTNFVVSSSAVGIGTATPNSTFQVSGSQAGNFLNFEALADLTLDETHHMVVFSNESDGEKCFLPQADTCGGRVYHIFNQVGGESGGAISIVAADGDTIEHQESLELDSTEGNTSVSIVSDGEPVGEHGGGNWLVFGQYNPSK